MQLDTKIHWNTYLITYLHIISFSIFYALYFIQIHILPKKRLKSIICIIYIWISKLKSIKRYKNLKYIIYQNCVMQEAVFSSSVKDCVALSQVEVFGTVPSNSSICGVQGLVFQRLGYLLGSPIPWWVHGYRIYFISLENCWKLFLIFRVLTLNILML